MRDQPKVVSLYSGAGGLDLGFQEAGFEIIWANDFDHLAVATHNANLGQHAIAVAGDIDQQELPSASDTEVVIGGPPCQAYSIAGYMDPDDPRGQHVFKFLEIVGRLQPQVFVLENVKALAVNTRWQGVRQRLFERAQELGYQTELFLLNAADYGVPQARERMFLVGARQGRPEAPQPLSSPPVTVREALEKLPAWGGPGNDNLCTAIITPAKKPVLRQSPFAGMLFNGQARPLNLEAPALTLPATMGGNRTPIIDQKSLETGVEPWVVGYHRQLRRGQPVVAKVPKRLRRITVQEAAALQTFPAEFVFIGSPSRQFRQIGNAVPPELARHVAAAIKPLLR